MRFREIYRTEVLQSRRDRSRRALFWSRVTGIALMLTIGAALRADPALRTALMNAGMNAMLRIADTQGTTQVPKTQTAQASPTQGPLPVSRIKINRPAATANETATSQAQETGRELSRAREIE